MNVNDDLQSDVADSALKTGGVARVAAAVAPLHAAAKVSSPQTSQLVAGHIVQLVEPSDDWWRVVGRDDYEGFMHRGYLAPSNGTESGWPLSLGATVQYADGATVTLPLNARFAPDASVVAGASIRAQDVASQLPQTRQAIAQSALKYFTGGSYQWGGVTPWGCDCSGLVQSAFALHGVMVPRDAWQQASAGSAIALNALTTSAASELIESDLLFFSDRQDQHVTHVGLVLSDFRMLHSALGRGGVRVESLCSDDAYIEKLRNGFVCARRIVA